MGLVFRLAGVRQDPSGRDGNAALAVRRQIAHQRDVACAGVFELAERLRGGFPVLGLRIGEDRQKLLEIFLLYGRIAGASR